MQHANANHQMGLRFMVRMAEDLKEVPVHDLLLKPQADLAVVLTVSSQFYSEETNEYLRAGYFHVVGKVTRILSGSDSINLARRSGSWSDWTERNDRNDEVPQDGGIGLQRCGTFCYGARGASTAHGHLHLEKNHVPRDISASVMFV